MATIPSPSNRLPPVMRERLGETRLALLRVHKALLDDSRIRYEREQGRIEGSGTFLRLVLHDPWFAWLHRLSELVVQIDELLAADEPASNAEPLMAQAKALLRPDENGDGFQRRYHRALQEVPEVVMAHAAAARVLAPRRST